jgi:ferredoxin
MKRNIIKIDEDKCNGCGICIPNCAEGALKIVNGKIKLVKESLCDGLGACVGRCPTGALVVEEREAESFDEEEAKKNMAQAQTPHQPSHKPAHAGGCPGSMSMQWNKPKADVQEALSGSALAQWPVQLKLLNPRAPYFQNADLVVAADCVPFSYPNFHVRFLKGKTLIIFCPKLDHANDEYIEKLTEIFTINTIKSISIIHMEVPCCSGTVHVVEEALKAAGKNITVKDYTISIKGEII